MDKTIQPELDALFDEWKKRPAAQNGIFKDGILDEALYWASMPRIVFLLKESYEDTFLDNTIAPLPEQCREGYGPPGSSPLFWPHLRSWQHVLTTRVRQAYGIIDSGTAERELAPEKLAAITKTPLTGVGYVNVKKAVGTSRSDWNDLRTHAANDAGLLKKQLTLMEPHIIFCCGYEEGKDSVFQLLQTIFAGAETASENGLFIIEKRILAIDWWHPSATGNYLNWENLDAEAQMQNPAIRAAIQALGWK